MLSVIINLYPYKLNLKKKEPIELNLIIKNLDDFSKSLVLDLSLDTTLSLDPKVLKSSLLNQKINDLKIKEEKHFRYKIYPSKGMHFGESTHNCNIKIYEYSQNFKQLQRVYEKNIKINVI